MRGVARFECCGAGFDEIVGGCRCGNFRSAGGGIFDSDELIFVGFYCASEGLIVGGARCGKIVQLEANGALDVELIAADFVGGAILGVIARDRDADGCARGFVGAEE